MDQAFLSTNWTITWHLDECLSYDFLSFCAKQEPQISM
jgi:hypothetical protein